MNERMIEIIREHIRKHPIIELVDVYKLLFQAANGPKHILMHGVDYDEIKRQWDSAIDVGEEPLEAISADGLMVRAHFAALKKKEVPLDNVMGALMYSVDGFQPRPELMIEWWKELKNLVETRALPLETSEYLELDEEFQQWGFIVKHHSQKFSEAYKPAYLVILKRYFELYNQL